MAACYDDGGFSGATIERPALERSLQDIEKRAIDCVVVYKVDRLSRSLLDFARLLSVFEQHGVSFVSVTQDFNTSTSLGRLTLNILLSFAQFEREIISERTRDKLSAARRKGKWTGGNPVSGYDIDPLVRRLIDARASLTECRLSGRGAAQRCGVSGRAGRHLGSRSLGRSQRPIATRAAEGPTAPAGTNLASKSTLLRVRLTADVDLAYLERRRALRVLPLFLLPGTERRHEASAGGR